MSKQKTWYRLLPIFQGIFLALAGSSVLLFRGNLLGWQPALFLLAFSAGALVLIGFFSLLVMLMLLRADRKNGMRSCLIAVGLSLPALIFTLIMGVKTSKVPPIHDISTDMTNPPQYKKVAKIRKSGEHPVKYAGAVIAEQQKKFYPSIKPLAVRLDSTKSFARCLVVADHLGWQIVSQDRQGGQIEAVATTPVFGFSDDIVIRITPNKQGSQIDIRSASRVGVSDLGTNARRISTFIQAFATMN